MPFTLFDLILFAIMIVSGLLAMMRGFTREALSLLAWSAAAYAAYLAIRQPGLMQIGLDYFDKELIAQIAVGGVVFVVALIILSIISVKISDVVVESAASSVDRTLGLFYGVARGFVFVTIAYLFYVWLVQPDKQDSWARSGRSLPYVQSTAHFIISIVPQEISTILLEHLKNQTPSSSATQTPQDQTEGPDSQGYRSNQTQGLDNFIQGTGSGTAPQKP